MTTPKLTTKQPTDLLTLYKRQSTECSILWVMGLVQSIAGIILVLYVNELHDRYELQSIALDQANRTIAELSTDVQELRTSTIYNIIPEL